MLWNLTDLRASRSCCLPHLIHHRAVMTPVTPTASGKTSVGIGKCRLEQRRCVEATDENKHEYGQELRRRRLSCNCGQISTHNDEARKVLSERRPICLDSHRLCHFFLRIWMAEEPKRALIGRSLGCLWRVSLSGTPYKDFPFSIVSNFRGGQKIVMLPDSLTEKVSETLR